jgi:cytochrome c oxidase assembly protein Cox11
MRQLCYSTFNCGRNCRARNSFKKVSYVSSDDAVLVVLVHSTFVLMILAASAPSYDPACRTSSFGCAVNAVQSARVPMYVQESIKEGKFCGTFSMRWV